VPNLPKVVARVPHWCDLLGRPSYPLQLQSEWGSVELLLLLQLKLLMVFLDLQRSARLSYGRCVNHMVLQWSTARTTSSGSWHGPLPPLFLSSLTSLHGALLVNGSVGKVIVGQVQILH
jgi:hypothetical protein